MFDLLRSSTVTSSSILIDYCIQAFIYPPPHTQAMLKIVQWNIFISLKMFPAGNHFTCIVFGPVVSSFVCLTVVMFCIVCFVWEVTISRKVVWITPGKLSFHFKIVVYGKTSERHFRDKAVGRFKRLIVSIVYVFVLLFIYVVRKTENVVPCRIDLGFQLSKLLQK
jgi:hypothetical protein